MSPEEKMTEPGGDNLSPQEQHAARIAAASKRCIAIVPPEVEKGNVEYKRMVHQHSPARLRSLATQMSYRLDEGHGVCTYRIGVEDDGCHSLLDYSTVSESARILECIGRTLNAVVTERKMIQGEIVDDKDGNPVLAEGEPEIFFEPSILGNDVTPPTAAGINNDNSEEEKKVTTGAEDDDIRLQKQLAKYTRAELTFQRIETHLLDPSPVSVIDLANATAAEKQNGSAKDSNGEGAATAAAAGDADAAPEASSSPDAANETPVAPVSNPGNANTPGTPTSPLGNKSDVSGVGETLSSRNIRVAVVGNVDAGKSTLIGTLTTSCLDDGRGKSRTAIMKHRHEIESGRTSTATTHLMGFRSSGEAIGGKDQIRANKRKGEDEIARESYRVITLMDLAGHEKYLKTTIHGVSSGFADYALILVNSRQPPTHMTQHHLNLCCSFGIPVLVVFTKIDGCPPHAFKNCKEEVIKMLRSPEVGRKPFAVRNENDVTTVMDKLHTLAPMLETSCVTGTGVDLLKKILFSMPKRRRHENKVHRKFEFLVEDIFNVPGVGAVVSGFVNAGELTVGTNCHVYVGPTDDGTFLKTVAKSAHIARINTTHITAGQSACLAFALNKDLRKKLRRGMVVLKENPTSTREFDAEICVLKGEGTTIRSSYQAYVHILNVRQSAFARRIEIVNNNAAGLPPSHSAAVDEDQEGVVLRPGSRAKVRFEFAKRPEYIRPGMRMLFRDGRVRGVGIITSVPKTTVVN